MLVYFTLDLSCLNRGALTNLLQVITKKLGCHKETARCSVFFACTQWLFNCYLHSLHKSRCECKTM